MPDKTYLVPVTGENIPVKTKTGFYSFKKLHKTETALFFPWLREFLPKEVAAPLAEFDRERQVLVRIGNKIGQVRFCF